jgi:hypothetical protein
MRFAPARWTGRTSPLRAESAQHVTLEMVDLVDAVADRAAAASGLGYPNADRGAVQIHLFAIERDVAIGKPQHIADTHAVEPRYRLGEIRQFRGPGVVVEVPDIGYEPGTIDPCRDPPRVGDQKVPPMLPAMKPRLILSGYSLLTAIRLFV